MSSESNKALVLEAFETLSNRRDYPASKRFWSERYTQHSAHMPGPRGPVRRAEPPASTTAFRVPIVGTGNTLWRPVMTTRTIKLPSPDHPITVRPNPNRVVVSLGGRVIADTPEALTLCEANYPPVQYIPRRDVDMAALIRSTTQTYCPYKGEAAYFSIPAGGERSLDAIWTYEAPYEAVAVIGDHLAFYPHRVDAIEEHT